MQNPVRHKLVDSEENYLWCSAHWFMRNADVALSKTVLRFKTDTVKIIDEIFLVRTTLSKTAEDCRTPKRFAKIV